MKRIGADLEAEHSHWPDGIPQLGEAHLWIHRPRMEPGPSALTKEELNHASRFRSQTAQQRFITRRTVLRDLLGWYLGIAPRTVPLQIDARGKPFLPIGPTLRFNASEADGLVALAFRVRGEIGIDVETIQRGISMERLAATFLTSGEMADLNRVETEERNGVLLQAWTRKEAFLKGVGSGLRGSPNRIETGLQGSWRLVRDLDSPRPSPWWVTDLEPFEGARLALATEGSRLRLRVFSGRPMRGIAAPAY